MTLANTHTKAVHYIQLQQDQIIVGDIQGEKFHKLPLNTFDYKNEENLTAFLNIVAESLTEEKPQILFFVHGMWESMPVFFRSDTDYLESNYIKNPESPVGAVVTVTWYASSLWYGNVRKNALAVVEPFQHVLNSIQDFKQANPDIPLNLLAHSIGNRIVLEALDQEYPELFNKMLLSAPDIPRPNEDNHRQYLNLVKIGHDILLVKNKRDKSLYLSAIVNKEKRIGRIGFDTSFSNNISTVEVGMHRDLKKIEAKILDHLHFKYSEATRKIMVDFLNK